MLVYVGIYSLFVEKGYQRESNFVSATEVSLRGALSDATTGRVYDAADLCAVEPDAFFVATALAVTQQAQGVCAGQRNTSACANASCVHVLLACVRCD